VSESETLSFLTRTKKVWRTVTEHHRVQEGLVLAGKEVRRDEAHIRYGTKRSGQIFSAEQEKKNLSFRWGCGALFVGTLGPVAGKVTLADGRVFELREKEKSKKKTEKKGPRRVEVRVVGEVGPDGKDRKKILPETCLWRSAPDAWLTMSENDLLLGAK
jgi:hypothetical protein